MLSGKTIIGEKIKLRDIDISDCNECYLQWMCDEDTNLYMETRWVKQTMDSIISFVSDKRESNDSVLFAIVESRSGNHIGNIKIGPIDFNNHYADISYFIGSKNCLRKGYASEAVFLATKYGFDELGLHRLQAGVIDGNTGSKKVLEKCGYKLEGRFLQTSYSKDDVYLDVFRYGIINNK